jgi:hypothetical protein
LTLETTALDREGHEVQLLSLADLIQHSKGLLSLLHVDDFRYRPGVRDANLRYIWSGLDASSLTELKLTFKCDGLIPPAVIAFLNVLQRQRALKPFIGELYVSNEWGAACLDEVLSNLISSNSTLTTFGLQLRSLLSSKNEHNVAILRAANSGLELNQSVRTLDGLPRHFDAVAESLRSLLQRNSTLARLQEYRSFDKPVEKEIKWLLDLNRYKRRCLLEPEEVPSGCWLGVVERITKDRRPDVMYHSLKRMPLSALRPRLGYRRPAPPI